MLPAYTPVLFAVVLISLISLKEVAAIIDLCYDYVWVKVRNIEKSPFSEELKSHMRIIEKHDGKAATRKDYEELVEAYISFSCIQIAERLSTTQVLSAPVL